MKTAIKLSITGIIALLAALIYTVPAHFVIGKLPPSATVQIAGVSGTLWQGNASQVVINQLSLGKVEWKASPLSLVTSRLKTHFKFSQPDLNGNGIMKIGLNSISLEDSTVFARSDALHPMLAQMIPSMSYTGTRLRGQLDLDLKLLQADRDGPRNLQGVLLWQDSGFTEPMSLSLGTINTVLSFENDQAIATIDNSGGELEISGNARMGTGWEYSTDILVSPNDETPDTVKNSLPILGQADRNGAVRLQNNDFLPVPF